MRNVDLDIVTEEEVETMRSIGRLKNDMLANNWEMVIGYRYVIPIGGGKFAWGPGTDKNYWLNEQ